MRKSLSGALVALAASAFLPACALPPPQRDARHEPGARAPSFTLEATGKKPRLSLEEINPGGTSVLVFYRGVW